MKANEAPEKIWVHELSAKELDVPLKEYHIEYARTDAFIEKAATWIANRYQANGSYLCADDIEDFEKYMKGE